MNCTRRRTARRRWSAGLSRRCWRAIPDLGTFWAPTGISKLRPALEFPQDLLSQTTEPAKRLAVFDQGPRHPRTGSFDAVLTLTDGTRLQARTVAPEQPRYFAQSLTDPTLLPVRPLYAVVFCTNYTDFRLLRGETLQTIPFENVKTAEVLSGERSHRPGQKRHGGDEGKFRGGNWRPSRD